MSRSCRTRDDTLLSCSPLDYRSNSPLVASTVKTTPVNKLSAPLSCHRSHFVCPFFAAGQLFYPPMNSDYVNTVLKTTQWERPTQVRPCLPMKPCSVLMLARQTSFFVVAVHCFVLCPVSSLSSSVERKGAGEGETHRSFCFQGPFLRCFMASVTPEDLLFECLQPPKLNNCHLTYRCGTSAD